MSRISTSRTARRVRWSRPVLWAERATLVPSKMRALIYGGLGITVLNLTLALFTSYSQYETDLARDRPQWVDPQDQPRIETLFDRKGQPSGYEYTSLSHQTTCELSNDRESYTCRSEDLRR